ncbi:hypothetical protein [Actinomyces wuliandei]|uniref:hypothetical protein n=1 Tax=Actinomyces wuliandei TaxID=2057743 RepID=UPI0019D4C383|nr:hypothetical protein [Actinomyces wuliandei]
MTRLPGWAPGSRTAVALLLPSVVLVVVTAAGQVSPVPLVLWTLLAGAVLLLNLAALHALAGRIKAR